MVKNLHYREVLVMYRKVMLIGLLAITASTMITAEAKAYSFLGGSLCLSPQTCPPSTYNFTSLLKGGGPIINSSTIITGQINVTDGFIICGSPGNQNDVSGGLGGTTPIISQTGNNTTIDKNGRIISTLLFGNRVGEFGDLVAFESFWDISSADCRNPNWTPLEVRIQNVLVTGKVFKNCTSSTDTTTCKSLDDQINLSCTTNDPLGSSVFTCIPQ